MGLLASAIEQPAAEEAEPTAASRCWRLWLEADRLKRDNQFEAANEALKASNAIAEALEWTHGTAPLWYIEAEALRGALLQDDGDTGAAFEMFETALRGWLYVGAALGGGSDLSRAALGDARNMISALAGEPALGLYAAQLGVPALDASGLIYAMDRFVPQMAEVAARTVRLTAQVRSYGEARRLVNSLLQATAGWMLPTWDPVRFEITLRLSLGAAATSALQFSAALGQADDALALVRRLPEGPERDVTEAELHANRASALVTLGRAPEAVHEFEDAAQRFRSLGRSAAALHVRFAALWARSDAGEPIGIEAVGSLLTETEEAAGQMERLSGHVMADLELLRRWYLVMLAEHGAGTLEEVVAVIELLRDDRPLMRSGTDNPDPVVARLCRPFAVLGARLAALPDTALLVLEPGLTSNVEDAPPAPLVLTIAAGGWHLANGPQSMFEALGRLRSTAARERERLNTRELPLQSEPSADLRQAAADAWLSLPSQTREDVLAARTVVCMPSSAAGLDRLPYELLLHEGGWLGETHVVARCPSFQYLEELVAPNSRRRTSPARATVAQVAAIEDLGVLDEAAADAQTAVRAAALLGLEPELRQVSSVEDARGVFAGAALVHYVGHGFASELGEWLPVSGDSAVTPSEVAWPEDEDAPAVFFNACLLGRVRHIAGGRQKGWAVTLLERGSPAVVGALASVPDTACPLVAREIYRAAWRAPVGEALRLARERLGAQGYHPLIAGAYVLHGDPNAVLSRTADAALPRATAELTTRWPALLTRFLATRAPEYRDALLADAPTAVRSWALGEDGTSSWPELLDNLDAEGAGALRIVLTADRLERGAPDPGAELQAGYLAAAALEDSYAMAYLLMRHRPLWQSLYPSESDALATTLEARLRMLDADRALFG